MTTAIVHEPQRSSWKRAFNYAALAAGLGAGIGIVYGFATEQRCNEGKGYFCGPGVLGLAGFSTGLLVVGVGGLVTAVFSDKHREIGAKVAGIGIGIPLLLGLAGRFIEASRRS